MQPEEEAKAVKEILANLLRAKKMLRMYPQGNPMYVRTLDDLYAKICGFFEYRDELTLKIGQNSIFLDSEQVYHNTEKEDNLAIFLFKDGIRELSFSKDLLRGELEEFMRIIMVDYDREIQEDDVVTLLWEKDFQNIRYVVDEAFLMEEIDEAYEDKAVKALMERPTDTDTLTRAYSDVLQDIKNEEKPVTILPATFDELQLLVNEIEKDASGKLDKLASILFEVFLNADGKHELEDAVDFLSDFIRFSMIHKDIHNVLRVLQRASDLSISPAASDEKRKYIMMLISYVNSEEIIQLLGELTDSAAAVEEEDLRQFTKYLAKEAVSPLIRVLGDLKTIRARKLFIEMIVFLGENDVQALAEKLDDQRWYVVRNIVYILRRIGDKKTVNSLVKTLRHKDTRVRKEVIRTLGEMNGQVALQALKECLADEDPEIRISSARAISAIGSPSAMKVILERISEKEFRELELSERKDFYEILSRWKDTEVFHFLVATLNRKSFFGMSRNYEDMACAAFALGLLGNRDALPVLVKYRETNNKLLKDYVNMAIKRIEHAGS
jgi:HEAT repeat protein